MAYNKKSWAKAKEEEKKKWADDALEQISFHKMNVEDVKEYFEFMSNMYDYSPRNIGMMKNQYPGAKFVASKDRFKELGFDILENQNPIKILAPNKVTYMKIENDNLKQLKYATKEEREKVKNKEIKTVQKTFYKLAPVYDLTQTNAAPEDYPKIYPNARVDLYLDNPKLAMEIKNANTRYLEKLGIPVSVENFSKNGLGTAKGYYEPLNHRIALNGLNTESENVMTLVHETAHALMHNMESTYDKEYKGSNVKELEAELTSFVVNKHFGIDTSEQTIPYIANWTDNLKNIKDIESSLKDIQHTSSRIINGIEENISKEFLKEMENVTVIDNISLDGNYPMDFEEFKELQSYLPIKLNTKTGIALKTTEISKPSYLVKRLDELSKTKTVGLDIDGNFKQPIIHIKETNQVMPLKVLSKNIKSNDFDIEAFTYEVYTNPHQKLFDGDFNVFNNKTVMEQVKIDADLNGVPDIYQKSIDNMKESNISRESTHEKKMELN
ncbi:LtrC-like protein [Macrococcoides caseolyticum]|uniref:ImmA/IrrE family metallo-endopeptidase n=1 Tax=Macrococcoides caseolyticum TaxID=69966 RepID=UPI00117075C3|nr:ImmA/IrrE family metallo-endopeptidase [Macrococcus caseolyticus]VUC64714.1 LtrC-like protein [Macrococcus caseolyticus]